MKRNLIQLAAVLVLAVAAVAFPDIVSADTLFYAPFLFAGVLTESPHAGEFILSVAHGNRSFDNGVLASGNNLVAGTVLGKLTSGGKWTAYDNVGSDGSEVAIGILFDAVDATSADAACVVVARDAEVIGDSLVYAASPTGEATAIVDLATVHIIVR